MSKFALTYGTLAGLFVIVLNLFIYLIDPMLLANWWLMLAMMPLMFIVLVFVGFNIRKAEGGYITFARAFVSLLVAGLLITACSTVYSIVLFHVIDPGLPELILEASFDKMLDFMERFDLPMEDIEAEFDKARDKAIDNFSISSQLLGIFTSGFWWAIGALIVGAIVKKNPPADLADVL